MTEVDASWKSCLGKLPRRRRSRFLRQDVDGTGM